MSLRKLNKETREAKGSSRASSRFAGGGPDTAKNRRALPAPPRAESKADRAENCFPFVPDAPLPNTAPKARSALNVYDQFMTVADEKGRVSAVCTACQAPARPTDII